MAHAELLALGGRYAATPKALADAEHTQPQSPTRAFASLEEQGLVSRRDDPADGRQVLLDITEAGRKDLCQHSATHISWLVEAMETELTPAEREVVRIAAQLLGRLADHQPQVDHPTQTDHPLQPSHQLHDPRS